MSRIPGLLPEQLDAAQRALYASIAEGPRAQGPQHFALKAPDGSLLGPFNALLLSPDLGAALQDVGAAVRFRTELTPRVREAAILLVAAHWDSAFERHAHESVGRAIGLTEPQLALLRAGEVPVFGDPADDACVAIAAALIRGDVTDGEWAAWVPVVGSRAVFELTTLVGYYATLALQLRVFRVGVDDG